MLARHVQRGEAHEAIENALDSINPIEKVEQTRREDGMLEYNPDMEIPGWGYGGTDPTEMPGMPPPASAAGDGVVDGFSAT
jgi:hypothetical protein